MAVRLLIEGLVQGVGFRGWMEEQARAHAVRGWVRNLKDGRVEAWLEGDTKPVELLVKSARIGPRFADVSKVLTEEQPDEGCERFEVRETMG